MTPRYTRSVAVALAASLALLAFGATGCGPSKTAIAVVNGSEIPKTAVDSQIAQMKKAAPASFEGSAGVEVEKQYRAQILDSLIQLELIKEAAKSLKVSVTAKQIDDYVAQLEQQYGGKEALATAMKSAGFDMTTLRDQINNNLLAEAVGTKVTTGTINVTDAEIKTYYDANKAQFASPAQVNAQHILVAAKDKSLAQSLLTQIRGGGDFAALAKKNSTDPGSKDKGGDLGWAAPSAYVTEFAEAVTEMKVKDVRLVETQYGWHIIKLLGRRAATSQTLAEATTQIKSTLEQKARSDKFTTYITDLEKKAKIEILDPALKKIIDGNKALESAPTTGSAQ
jgi:foldase protein PrsA